MTTVRGPVVGTASLVLDPSSVERTHGDHIDGRIWIDIDGEGFPDVGWWDFPLPVISACVDAILVLLGPKAKSERIWFYDGPRAARFEVEGPTAWRVSGLDTQPKMHRVRLAATVDPSRLVASTIAAGDTLLRICREQGWESDKSKNLANGLASLRTPVPEDWLPPSPALKRLEDNR